MLNNLFKKFDFCNLILKNYFLKVKIENQIFFLFIFYNNL